MSENRFFGAPPVFSIDDWLDAAVREGFLDQDPAAYVNSLPPGQAASLVEPGHSVAEWLRKASIEARKVAG